MISFVRHAVFSLICLAIPFALAACGGSEEDTSSNGGPDSTITYDGPPVHGDSYVTNPGAEPGHLNPVVGNDSYTTVISAFMFDQILAADNETLEWIPHVAKSWEVSDDHLTYTFHVREDVYFHDGVQLTAHDLKFSYDIIMDPKTDSAAQRNYLEDIERVEIVDDFTIRYHMKKPYFRHLLVIALTDILPKHVYGEGDINKHPNNRNPVGSGPYKFERWDTGQQIVLTRNEEYWGPEVFIDKRVFKIVTDDEASFQLLEREELDMMRVPPEKWVSQAEKPEFKAKFNKIMPPSPAEGTLNRYNYIGWNLRKPQFEDKRVRQALTMLFDRQLVLDTIFEGIGTIVTGSTPPHEPEYNHDVKPWPFDPERAQKLLDDAGWIDRDRNGVREKDGVELSFELSFTSQVAEYERLATVYQEELQRAGVKMNINPIEWATFLERVYDRSFDACMLAWVSPILQDLFQIWHSSMAPDGSNHPGFINAEVDQILEDFRLEFDRDKRVKLYHRLHEILHEEQPYTFLFDRPGLIAVHNRFQNIEIYPTGTDSREWFVPKHLQMYP